MLITIIFMGVSLLAVLGAERLTRFIVRRVFSKHTKDIEEQERQLAEYHELSLLALMAKNRTAYDGFQDMAREMYWRLFFRKLIVSSSTFFLLLSPYMLLSQYTLQGYLQNPFGYVFITAILYFMSKTIVMYVLNVLHSRKQALNIK